MSRVIAAGGSRTWRSLRLTKLVRRRLLPFARRTYVSRRRPRCPAPSRAPGAHLCECPFRADDRVRSRARLRAVLDAEYGRVRMWRNERRINGRPSDARGLPRVIAALDEHGTCR